ncbi:unnamed protein product [marine sediment metagenome]|uniref:Uncharacterized protein n=1 Tax=marine sediment metagenome TaxID=412755 RepID=X1NK75_9ZZZZ
MEIELEVEGGASGELKTTHDTGALPNQDSVETNFVAETVIHWVCTDAAVLALLGGDSVKAVVRHEVGADGDSDTDADFRRVLIHVV